MLESLVDFKEVNEKPYLMFVWAFTITSVAILLCSQIPFGIPNTDTGFIAILLTIIPSTYFITLLIKKEELLEESYIKKHLGGFWQRHEKDILLLLFFFAGMTVAFSIWTLFLPGNFFLSQMGKITQIRGVTAGVSAEVTGFAFFQRVFLNNLNVLLFSFLFAFIFGAGAIFILTWNASVLGVYIGQLSKYLWYVPVVSVSFIPHGLPEIAGYLCAGLAGGLFSAAIIRKNSTKVLKTVALDSAKILLLGVFLIFIGAVIESFL